jgi:hypothetical protein
MRTKSRRPERAAGGHSASDTEPQRRELNEEWFVRDLRQRSDCTLRMSPELVAGLHARSRSWFLQ